MGVCCTGKMEKEDNYRNMVRASKRVNSPEKRVAPIINYYIEKNKLNENIDNLLVGLSEDKNIDFPISKINFEEIYNIFLKLKYDYVKCEYVFCDLRKTHPDNFIKNLKNLNYTPEDVLTLNTNKVDNLQKYLNNKNLVFIIEEESIQAMQNYIEFFLLRKFKLKAIYILDSSLGVWEKVETNKILLKTINYTNKIEKYPFILLSMKYLLNLNSKSYLLFQKFTQQQINNKKANYFLPEYLSNSEIDPNDEFLIFSQKFNITAIIQYSKGNKPSGMKDFKRRKTISEDSSKTVTCSLLQIYFTDINTKEKFTIEDSISLIKNYLEKDKTVLIQIDSSFDDLTIIKLIYIILYKTAFLTKDQIKEHLFKFDLPIENMIDLIEKEEESILETGKLFDFS